MKRSIITIVFLLFAIELAHAQADNLDKTFGDGGTVKISFDWCINIIPHEVITLPGGKILHVGLLFDTSASANIYLMRHNKDGETDSSFGNQGLSLFPLKDGASIAKIYRYPDGRLLVYGNAPNKNSCYLPFIIRFFENGVVDKSFGNGGNYETKRLEVSTDFTALKVETDGTIYAFGAEQKDRNSNNRYYPTVTRITSSGKNDTLFGDMGVKYIGSEADTCNGGNVVIYGEDRCVYGISVANFPDASLNMLCTDFSGKVDSLFGINGRIKMNLSGGNELVSMMRVCADGKILCTAAIKLNTNYHKTILLRLLPNGELDTSFGNLGIAPIPDDKYTRAAYKIAVDSNKNIIQWGWMTDVNNEAYLCLMYYFSNGQIDSSRGGNGTSKEFRKYFWGMLSAAVDHDGRFVILGENEVVDKHIVVLCRLNNIVKQQVSSTTKGASLISLHPTPSLDNCTVTYTLPTSGNCTMSLRDESGRKVRSFARDEYRTSGEHEEELDLRGLAAGVYFLQIESGGAVQSAKLIKQ